MKNQKKFDTNEDLQKILMNTYFEKSIQKIDNSDADINHLEKIFTDETYYLAMKIVPLIERKVLYLSYIENCKLNDICRKLKLSKKEVICLRNKGIQHFKTNLSTLCKVNKYKKGGGC